MTCRGTPPTIRGVSDVADASFSPPQRRARLRYARRYGPRDAPGVGRVAIDLLRPRNAITLCVCVGIVAISHALGFMLAGGSVPLVLPVGLGLLLVASHYVNVLDDLGPQFLDEVPAVLRDGELGDDVAVPFGRLLLAATLCFGPAAVLWQWVGAFALLPGLVGVLAAPMVLLTIVEASTPGNLSPGRVIVAARACGWGYLQAVGLFVVAAALHAGAVTLLVESCVVANGRSLLVPRSPPPLLPVVAGAYALALPAVYAAHLFAAWTAALYRQHHEDFGWLCQRHERSTVA